MSQIIVIGCGFRREQLTLEAVDALQSADKVLLHTGQCGLAEYLQEKGMPYETLDALYERAEDFDEHALLAARAVAAAAQAGSVGLCGVRRARCERAGASANGPGCAHRRRPAG